MNTSFSAELTRNSTGYFLVLVGLIAMGFGGHFHFDKMIDSGYGLVGAALLAFQSKHPSEADAPPTIPK